MRKKLLQKAFLLAAFLMVPLGCLGVVDWNAGDTIHKTDKGYVVDDTLNINGNGASSNPIKIDGDVYIKARNANTTVNVTADTLLVPANGKEDFAHLIFHPARGREITVNVNYDLKFRGLADGTAIIDFIITFSGRGTTRFKLNECHDCYWRGVTVTFDSQAVSDCVEPGECIAVGKTRVYILMDQPKSEAFGECAVNKVVFERMHYCWSCPTCPPCDPCDPCDPCCDPCDPCCDPCDPCACPPCDQYCLGRPTRVVVGPSSFITYLSTNAAGWPCGSCDPCNPCELGYGTLAFDPTHCGNGRMVLEIKGDPCPTYNYHDGAVIVDGHYVPSFSEEDIRKNAYLNANAGVKAIFRIIDDVAYRNRGNTGPYDPADTARKGLLVINTNTTVPQSANDPYGWMNLYYETKDGAANTHDCYHPNLCKYWVNDYSWYNAIYNKWVVPNKDGGVKTFNVRTGFTLGKNGWMGIYHKTFLDYVACGIMELDFFVNEDYADWIDCYYNAWDEEITPANPDAPDGAWPSVLKWRNPAAFHVDGLNHYANFNDYLLSRAYKAVYTEDGYKLNNQCDPYKYYGTNAQIVFYGDAGAYFRACQCEEPPLPYECEECEECYFKQLESPCVEREDTLQMGLDFDGDVPTRAAAPEPCDRDLCYGPFFAKGGYECCDTCPCWKQGDVRYSFTIDCQEYNGEYIRSDMVTLGEGKHVIDVEGRLRVDTFGRNAAPRRLGAYVPAPLGGPIEKGFINMPTVMINHRGEEVLSDWSPITRPLKRDTVYCIYESPSWFINDTVELYNTRYEHNDVVKAEMQTDPYAAPPAIVGGERLYFMNEIWPELADDPFYFEHFEFPKIFLYDSDVNLHESLVSSGVRWIFTEELISIFKWFSVASLCDLDSYGLRIYGGEGAENTSVIRCFDHGDDLDTLQKGYGRMFMVGCGYNLMANDSSNWATESGYVNGYRSVKVPTGKTPADTIKLSLRSQFEPGVEFYSDRGAILPDDPEEEAERAQHLFLLSRDPYEGGVAYMALGWTFTVGDQMLPPWLFWIGNVTDQFPIDTSSVSPATLSIDGNYYYFGGTDYMGNKARVPVVKKEQGSIIYVNHGGRLSITQPSWGGYFDPEEHGYDCFVDTQLAYRLWPTENLCGIIDLPKDQVVYGDSCCSAFGRQPYDIDTSINNGPLRVRVYNTTSVVPTGRIAKDQKSGEEVVIAWNARPYQQRGWDPSFLPVKKLATRFTAIVDEPVALPDNLLYFGTNDHVTQLKVSGATLADPLHLLITGDEFAHGYGWVKEIVSLRSSAPEWISAANYLLDSPVWGEGDHGIIFLQNGGRVGLGSRAWNDLSENAWNRLGKDHVTICPDSGNCWVDVNSDLLVTDPVAIVPTENFGTDLLYDDYVRLTFYSEQEHKIVVPAGGELDLSSFGNYYQQQIEFGGKVKLVFEPGATLRFPVITDPEIEYPVLYFNDEAELIFEGAHEMGKGRYASIAEADAAKCKIVGCGEIWLNKNAKMRVMGNAQVAVQSDWDTNVTDLTISIQRHGEFNLGDRDETGGSFEVGNPDDYRAGQISFTLLLNGARALCALERGAFLGFGAGVVNKPEGPMNGSAVANNNPVIGPDGTLTWNPASDGWQVKALYDVKDVSVQFGERGGIFRNNHIFDGSNRNASLFAIGPISGNYYWSMDNMTTARVLGGGNFMYLAEGSIASVNTFDYADAEPREDGDMYSIMASALIISQQTSDNIPGSTIEATANGGQAFTGEVGDSRGFYTYLAYPTFTSLNTKLVTFSRTEYENYMGYVNDPANLANGRGYVTGAQIERATDVNLYGVSEADLAVPLNLGVLGSANADDADQLVPVGLI